jgi:dipeptide/tripeptide permease
VQSAGDFAASVVVGLLWTLVSPAVGFGYAAAWMVAALGVGWAASRARPTTTGHDDENQR